MGFLDKAKEAATDAAAKAKEGANTVSAKAKEEAGELKAKRDASQGYAELGRETHKLIQAGEISHPTLAPIAERITEAEAAAAGAEPVAQDVPAAAAPPAEPAA